LAVTANLLPFLTDVGFTVAVVLDVAFETVALAVPVLAS
jgi:hypothetical protein